MSQNQKMEKVGKVPLYAMLMEMGYTIDAKPPVGSFTLEEVVQATGSSPSKALRNLTDLVRNQKLSSKLFIVVSNEGNQRTATRFWWAKTTKPGSR